MRGRIVIIANPVSGSGKGLRLARAVSDLLQAQGEAPEIAETEAAGDARRIAEDSVTAATVVAVGGDGTVNEVLNGLAAGPALAMIPGGTANVLAKELGLPRDARGLARVLAEGRAIPWDLGVDRVSGRKFLLFASAGYDAHVVHLFHAARKGPVRMWQYLWWGAKSILQFRAPRVGVELDGVSLGEAAWVIVSNVAAYGGPLVFTPRAKADDGTFEVLVQRGGSRFDVVKMFARAFTGWLSGDDLPLPGVSFHQARRVRLTSLDGAPVPLQVDGDPAGQLPADLELVPGGVRVLAP
ncbi:MAG TPA: diacylglycerol kinase family protein [Planctomycetota bacterium]